MLNQLENKGMILGGNSYRQGNFNSELMFEQFLRITFEILGHMSKAKGFVTPLDIDLVENLMDKMNLEEEKRVSAQTYFNLGKDQNYPLKHRLSVLYNYYYRDAALLRFFLETQIDAACVDGNLHPNEVNILYIIAKELNISRVVLEQQVRTVQATYHFKRQDQYEQQRQKYREQRQEQEQENQQRRQQRKQGQPDYTKQRQLYNAYVVLGAGQNASDTEIKHSYRRLMNAHHPDKLAAKGLPPEMMDIAKQKTQEIQSAYEMVKNARGFK